MGFHISQQLVNHGAKVYIATRSESSVKDAISKIESQEPELKGKNQLVFLHLDLSTIRGARDAADNYLKLESRIDILSEFIFTL